MEDVSREVLEKNKKYLRSKDKAKYDMMYQDIYNCICQNTIKLRYTIQYVKPTAQLVFKNRFPKGGPTCRRQVVNPRHQTSQGQWNLVLGNGTAWLPRWLWNDTQPRSSEFSGYLKVRRYWCYFIITSWQENSFTQFWSFVRRIPAMVGFPHKGTVQ